MERKETIAERERLRLGSKEYKKIYNEDAIFYTIFGIHIENIEEYISTIENTQCYIEFKSLCHDSLLEKHEVYLYAYISTYLDYIDKINANSMESKHEVELTDALILLLSKDKHPITLSCDFDTSMRWSLKDDKYISLLTEKLINEYVQLGYNIEFYAFNEVKEWMDDPNHEIQEFLPMDLKHFILKITQRKTEVTDSNEDIDIEEILEPYIYSYILQNPKTESVSLNYLISKKERRKKYRSAQNDKVAQLASQISHLFKYLKFRKDIGDVRGKLGIPTIQRIPLETEELILIYDMLIHFGHLKDYGETRRKDNHIRDLLKNYKKRELYYALDFHNYIPHRLNNLVALYGNEIKMPCHISRCTQLHLDNGILSITLPDKIVSDFALFRD